MEQTSGQQVRNFRFISSAPTLPLLGERDEDLAVFEYVPLDLSFPNFNITLPHWLVEQERLREGQAIYLNATLALSQGFFSSGHVSKVSTHPSLGAEVVTLTLSMADRERLPVWLSPPALDLSVQVDEKKSLAQVVLRLLKDAIILKKGERIFVANLIPLFARLSGMSPQEFRAARQVLFDDVVKSYTESISALEKGLEEVRFQLLDQQVGLKGLASSNLELILNELRKSFPFEVFRLTFDSLRAHYYLRSIKHLERRIFTIYNQLVVLYARS